MAASIKEPGGAVAATGWAAASAWGAATERVMVARGLGTDAQEVELCDLLRRWRLAVVADGATGRTIRHTHLGLRA